MQQVVTEEVPIQAAQSPANAMMEPVLGTSSQLLVPFLPAGFLLVADVLVIP